MCRVRIGLSVLAIAASAPAWSEAAADASAESDVVVTAAGFEQKITDAPASISVVTAEELKQRPYLTLIDAVRDLEGVDVGETSDKTGQRTISIRGMGSDYTLILVDGKRQNNHGDIYPNNFGGNQFNHIPPLDTIERIEVIRGPASTLYGADALGGVINIITKKVSDRWSGSATFSRSLQEDDSFGDDMTLDIGLAGPIVPGLFGLRLRGSIYERNASAPDFEPVVDPAGVTHVRGLGFGAGGKTVDNTNRSAGFSVSLTPTSKQSLVFDFDISKQEYDNTPVTDPATGATSFPLGTVDSIDTIWLARGGIVAPRVGYSAEQTFDRMNWALTHQGEWGIGNSFVSLAYVETDNNGRTLPFSVAERVLLQQMYSGTGDYAGLSTDERRAIAEDTFLPRPKRTLQSNQYTLDARLDIPLENLVGTHRFVVGGQFIDGDLTDSVFGLEASAEGVAAAQKQRQWSLFAEDNWSPVEALTITGGIRYDEHDMFGGQVSPRLYAVHTLTPSLTIKGGVSTGFKTPKTTDLYDGITGYGGQGTNPWVGNPDLKPETSVNSEVALYWSQGGNSFNVTLFRNDFEDKIMRMPVAAACSDTGGVRPCANLGAYWEVLGIGGLTQPVNIDKARIQGVEVAGRYEIISGLALRANYTFTDSEQLSGANEGQPLTNSARHMANATLDWRATERLSAQLSGELRSKRYRGVDAVTGDHLYYRSYTVMNLGAQYRFNDYVTVSGRVNNLLDEDFTSYDVAFADNGDGSWTPNYTDHFNNKDKARSYWISINARF
ncbi:MAG: TonB-dependent receptor [Alphaproteobacteria bacterium]|nr:TonB-dependent receptor [Alphaproteobacteria bacterium]MBU0793502.1 TonB-dependent receptor [Alphaproteobacteria bacterium]MBU0875246.1 TonB-dependent receptor [Alphaproteobacteria bacterium]MBU1771218.1 TonB-dependent receptor [Alphaproteobacteria bacterium]